MIDLESNPAHQGADDPEKERHDVDEEERGFNEGVASDRTEYERDRERDSVETVSCVNRMGDNHGPLIDGAESAV